MSDRGANRAGKRDALVDLFDELDEDDFPTAVAAFDLAAYARASMHATTHPEANDAPPEEWSTRGGPESGIRPSFPTLTREVGALENEPEEDAILRWLGGGDRELRVRLTAEAIAQYPLRASDGYLLAQIDGVTTITDLVDISPMPRDETLRAILELLRLGIVA